MSKERVLITGGSGFLGINLVRYLIKKGYSNILVLDIIDFDYPDVASQIEFMNIDIRDSKRVSEVMDKIDIVIHAAAALPLYTEQEIFTTDVDGTSNLFASAFDSKVKRFIQISTTAVYGIPDHHPLLEEDDLISVGPYGKAKIQAEKISLQYRNKGMCVPILRPKSFVGPERLGVFALLFDWAKDGHNFPIIGNGKNHYQLLDVEDLCQAIYLCMQLNMEKVNETFNIGAKEFKTMKEDYQVVLDRAGFNKKILTFPALPVIYFLRILEFMKLSPLYKWVYETASKDSFVSIEKAEKNLGFSPKYSNQEALIRNYEWYLGNIDEIQGKFGVSHRVPWKQGILGLLKKIF
jgi:nucleoside-diphosphate-sugar epimerase